VQSRVTRQQRHQNHGPQPQAQSRSRRIARRRDKHKQATKDYTGEFASVWFVEDEVALGKKGNCVESWTCSEASALPQAPSGEMLASRYGLGRSATVKNPTRTLGRFLG